jgi:hypothetical protein
VDAVIASGRSSSQRLVGVWEPHHARGALVRLAACAIFLLRHARQPSKPGAPLSPTDDEIRALLREAEQSHGSTRGLPTSPGAIGAEASERLDSVEDLLERAAEDKVQIARALEQHARAMLVVALLGGGQLDREYGLRSR